MRVAILALLPLLALTACGGSEKPVVVNAPPGSVVTIPGSGQQPVVTTPERR